MPEVSAAAWMPMDIDRYSKVDCERLRLPPLDWSVSIDSYIERAIAEAYRGGIAPQQVIESLANDKRILDPLTGQLRQAMEYQRNHALESIAHESRETISKYRAAAQERIATVEQSLEQRAKSAEETARAAAAKLQERSGAYSLAERRLQEMRERIEQKYGTIGGQQGYEVLQRIGGKLAETPAYAGQDPSGPTRTGAQPDAQPYAPVANGPQAPDVSTAGEAPATTGPATDGTPGAPAADAQGSSSGAQSELPIITAPPAPRWRRWLRKLKFW